MEVDIFSKFEELLLSSCEASEGLTWNESKNQHFP